MMHTDWLVSGLIAACVLLPGLNASAQGQSAAVNTCITCHAKLDEEKMSKPVALWHTSVHKPAGISCQDCHGGNPTAGTKELAHDLNARYIGAPDPAIIHDVCGTCHQLQKDNYVASPHGLTGSFWPGCVDCHSNHDVKAPIVADISVPDKCDDCHDQDVLDAFIRGVDRGLKPLAAVRQDAEALRPAGVPVDEILAQITMADDAFGSRASHTFNLEQIYATVDSLERGYGNLQKQVTAARIEVGIRRRFGWMFAALFVVMSGVIYLYRRSLPDE